LIYEPDTSGTVYCSFIVNIDGSLTDFKIVKGVNDNIGQEVIRLLKTIPNWSPGILNGQKVRVRYTLPIKFKG
jgi:protein TonB